MDVPLAKQEDGMITTQEAMLLLGVSRTTIHALIREGYLHPETYSPALKRPKRHYFRREEIDLLLKGGRRAVEQSRAMQRRAS